MPQNRAPLVRSVLTRFFVPLLLAALLAACAQVQTPPVAVTGSLRVVIEGLSAAASVRVTGEDVDRTVSATTTLEGLAPGSYAVTAEPVTVNGATHTAQVTGSPVEIVAGATAEVAVAYTRNALPVVAGLAGATLLRNTLTPRSATLAFTVSDPDGDTLTVSAAADDPRIGELEPSCDAGGACELVVTPTADASFEATLTVTVDDGKGGVATASAAVTAAARLVTAGVDAGPGSLRALVAEAEPGDVVGFAAGVTGTVELTSEIAIATPLTIEGPGADALAFDGLGASRIFAVGAATVTIADLTLQNGATTAAGGAVTSSGDLTLQRVSVRSSRSEGIGGGVHQNGGSLALIGGELVGNIAGTAGGGLAAVNADTRVAGTRVAGNRSNEVGAASAGGGGVFVQGGSAHLTDGAVVDANRSTSGGGLMLVGAAAVVIDGASVVSGNEAADDGGGLYASDGASVRIAGGEVTANSGRNGGGVVVEGAALELVDAEISGNLATINGGGVVTDGPLTASGATRIAANHAGSNAGGVYLSGGAATFGAEVVIEDNRADANAGGVYAFNGTATLNGTTVRGNVAGRNGGGIYNSEEVTLIGATLGGLGDGEGNVAGDDPEFGGIGGGLYTVGPATIERSEVLGNRATGRAGGIYHGSSELTLRDTEVVGNEALGGSQPGGGGLWSGAGTTTATVLGGAFRANRTEGLGGAISASGRITIDGTTIGGPDEGDGNRALSGGGVALLQADVVATIANSLIVGNEASSVGGGVYLVGPVGGAALTLETTILRGNRAESSGGGLAVLLAEALELGPGVVIETNVAGGDGGGIYINTLEVAEIAPGLVVRGNVATGSGGGIATEFGADITLSEAVIGGASAADGNRAGADGGGIYANFSDVTLVDSRVENNTTDEHGGGVRGSSGVIVLERTTLGANRSGGNGGAIATSGGDLQLRGARIEGNEAAGSGGGVATDSGTAVVVETAVGTAADISTRILGNVAGLDGGGLHLDGGTLTAVDSAIGGSDAADGNRAGGDGGGIWLGSEAEATVTTSLVRSNVAGGVGGGLAVRSAADFDMAEGDVRFNSATDGGGGFFYVSEAATGSFIDVDIVDNDPNDIVTD